LGCEKRKTSNAFKHLIDMTSCATLDNAG
jgi:hypothetical protein